MLMDEHLGRMAEEFGDQTAFAVVDVGDHDLRRVGRRGQRPGPGPGRRRPRARTAGWASISTPSSAPALAGVLPAVHRAGGVAVPMNPRLAPAEVAHMLSHSGATAVVADGDLVAQRPRGWRRAASSS